MISVLTIGTQADAPHAFTDASAIRGLLNDGDQAAATWLFKKYSPLVWHICSRRLPRAWMAEDAVQDTMVRCFQSLRHFDTQRSFSAWLTTIAARVCVDLLRTVGRRLEVPLAEIEETKALDLPDEARAQAVREMVCSLSAGERMVVELHYFEGLTAREVASRAGLSPANVAIRLMRARQALAGRAAEFGV